MELPAFFDQPSVFVLVRVRGTDGAMLPEVATTA
jgi:hypothetical protein